MIKVILLQHIVIDHLPTFQQHCRIQFHRVGVLTGVQLHLRIGENIHSQFYFLYVAVLYMTLCDSDLCLK